MKAILTFVALALIASSGSAATTGAILSVSQKGLSGWLNDFESTIKNILNDLKIPDVDKDGLKLFDMHTFDFDGDFSESLSSDKGIELSSSFKIRLHMHYDYHNGIIHTGGECDFQLKGAELSVSAVLEGDNGKLKLGNTDADVSAKELEPSCDGVSGAIINVIVKLFNSEISDELGKLGKTAILQALNSYVGPALSKIDLDFPITDDFALVRFDVNKVTFTSQLFSASLLGDCVNKKNPQDPPGTLPPPNMPNWDATVGKDLDVQIALSAWSLESALYTYVRAGRLSKVIPHNVIPSSSPVQLNTTDMSVFAPALKLKYPNMWMQLNLTVNQSSVVIIANKYVNASLPSILKLQIVDDKNSSIIDGFDLLLNLDISFSVSVVSKNKTEYLAANINKATFTASLIKSYVGPVVLLPSFINLLEVLVQSTIIPDANKVLNGGFLPLPSSSQVELEESFIGYRDSYLVIGSNIKITP
eukprot:m.342035 g.342035  ORF g.342035 m.342035 type:complete len:475 (+) comp20830_c0_seq1:103-1527(+)